MRSCRALVVIVTFAGCRPGKPATETATPPPLPEVPTQPAVQETLVDHGAPIVAMAGAPAAGLLCTATADGRLRTWQVADATVVAEVQLEGTIADAVMSSDGALVAVATSAGLVTWTVATGELHTRSTTDTSAVALGERHGDAGMIHDIVAVTAGAPPGLEVYQGDARRCAATLDAATADDVAVAGLRVLVAEGERVTGWSLGCKREASDDVGFAEPVEEIAAISSGSGWWLAAALRSGAVLVSLETRSQVGPQLAWPETSARSVDLWTPWLIAGDRLVDARTLEVVSELAATGPARLVGDRVWFARGDQLVSRDLPAAAPLDLADLAAIAVDPARPGNARKEAAGALAERGVEVVPVLDVLARGVDLDEVVRAIGATGDDRAIPVLAAALPPAGRGRIRPIALELAPFGERASAALPELLAAAGTASNDDDEAALARVFGLIGAGAAEALPFLERLADGKSSQPRSDALAAIAAMGRVGAPSLVRLSQGSFAYSGGFPGAVAAAIATDAEATAVFADALATTTGKARLRLISGLERAGTAAASAIPALEGLHAKAKGDERVAIEGALAAIRATASPEP